MLLALYSRPKAIPIKVLGIGEFDAFTWRGVLDGLAANIAAWTGAGFSD